MPKLRDLTVGDVAPSSPGGVCCFCCLTILNIVMLILCLPMTVQALPPFHIGLERNTLSGVVHLEKVYHPGRYWIGFWKDFVLFPSTLNTIEFSDSVPEEGVQHLSVLRSRDKDGKQIFLDISVQYFLIPDKVGQLYRDMTIQYEDVYISELRDAFTKAGNEFVIAEVWGNYSMITQKFQEKCEAVLLKRQANCWGVQIWGVRLESRYEEALVRTQVRKQAQRTEMERKVHATIRAETQVVLASYRYNVTVIESQAQAAKYNIERAAKAKAERALVALEARVLNMTRTLVVPSTTAAKMTDVQLIKYQKYLALADMKDASMLFHPFGGSIEPTNAFHSKKLMSGSRLLQGLEASEGDYAVRTEAALKSNAAVAGAEIASDL